MPLSPTELSPPQHAVCTRTCYLWYDRFLYGRFHDAIDVNGDDARENLRVSLELVGGASAPVLIDLRPIRSQTSEARAVFAGPDATVFTKACALVIANPLSRVLGNFYLGFNRPQSPTRLFNSIADAEAWLTTFLSKTHGG